MNGALGRSATLFSHTPRAIMLRMRWFKRQDMTHNAYSKKPEGLCFFVNSELLPWQQLAELEIGGDGLWMGDPTFMPAANDGLVVLLGQGKYAIEYKSLVKDNYPLVVCMRCFRLGAETKRGEIIGNTWTDVACTGIVDFRRALEFFDSPMTDDEACAFCEVQSASLITLSRLGRSLDACIVTSGGGDGSYPVYELVGAGQRSGLEVRFVEDGSDLVPDV